MEISFGKITHDPFQSARLRVPSLRINFAQSFRTCSSAPPPPTHTILLHPPQEICCIIQVHYDCETRNSTNTQTHRHTYKVISIPRRRGNKLIYQKLLCGKAAEISFGTITHWSRPICPILCSFTSHVLFVNRMITVHILDRFVHALIIHSCANSVIHGIWNVTGTFKRLFSTHASNTFQIIIMW